jgi:anti-anti-sigma factor
LVSVFAVNGAGEEDALAVDVDHRPGSEVALLRLAGEVDTATVGDLEAVLERVVAAGATDLRLDLDAVPFMDSTGLTALITVRSKLGGQGRVTVERALAAVRRTFEVAGLTVFLER